MQPRAERDELALSVAAGSASGAEEQARKRSTTSRVAAVAGGLALVGAAIGLVGVGLASTGDASANAAAGPSYSADLVGAETVTSAGVKGGKVKGKADLDIDNVLTWTLRKLDPDTSGTIHLHAGRSCGALGSSLWDTQVTSSNPWTEVTWSSDSAGESAGALDIDDVFGAYSFPANLEHAVVFYSHDEQVLACGVLKPEGDYRKFGVQSSLNNGFVEHQSQVVAGEVILSKDNVLSWGVYNLEVEQSGFVSILAGRDCSNPDATWFTGEWNSDKWGVARSELALDSQVYDFSQVVGRAVAVRDPQGAVVACDILSSFVERTPTAVREVRAELRDIVDTYKSEGHSGGGGGGGDGDDNETPAPPSKAFAVLGTFSDTAVQCYENGGKSLRQAAAIYEFEYYLVENKTAYDSATLAAASGTASADQLELIHSYESREENKTIAWASFDSLQQFYNSTCRRSPKCSAFEQEFSSYKRDELAARADEFALAVAAVQAGNATAQQQDAASKYYALLETYASIENHLDERVDEMDAACPPNYICLYNSLHNRCTTHEKFDAIRYDSGGKSELAARFYIERAGLYPLLRAYWLARETGNATPEQIAAKDRNWYLQYVGTKIMKSRIAPGRRMRLQDPTPTGNITLSGDNVLSWKLSNLLLNRTGHIMIHEGTSCHAIGGQAALEGTNPYTTVSWDTTGPDNKVLTEGSMDLSMLPGALSFSSNYPRAVVVYSPEMDPIACGVLTLQ